MIEGYLSHSEVVRHNLLYKMQRKEPRLLCGESTLFFSFSYTVFSSVIIHIINGLISLISTFRNAIIIIYKHFTNLNDSREVII